MLTDDTPAARVRFFGPVPPKEQMYWRGLVMVHFDGRTWIQSPAVRYFPAPVVSLGPNRWDYELELEPTDREQLVALDLPAAAPAGATLGADYALRVTKPLGELSRWRMQSAPPQAFEPQLERNMRRDAPGAAAGLQPANARAGPAMARRGRQRRRRHRPTRTGMGSRRVRLHPGRATARPPCGRRVPVHPQGRLLRALQFRVRRADARRRHPRACDRRLCGR